MRHVLVVDDSTVVRKIVRRILESADVRVSEASSARRSAGDLLDFHAGRYSRRRSTCRRLMVTNSLGNFAERRVAIVRKSSFA